MLYDYLYTDKYKIIVKGNICDPNLIIKSFSVNIF